MAKPKDDVKQVVAVRLAGWELFVLDQLADLTGESRSDTVRNCIAEQLRRTMREHPEWPMHPAWVDGGAKWGQENGERWIFSMFQHWAWAIADADPTKHLQKTTLDGVTGYRWREGRPVPKLTEWKDHVERYHARQEKEGR